MHMPELSPLSLGLTTLTCCASWKGVRVQCAFHKKTFFSPLIFLCKKVCRLRFLPYASFIFIYT